jgi:hypothetical protein
LTPLPVPLLCLALVVTLHVIALLPLALGILRLCPIALCRRMPIGLSLPLLLHHTVALPLLPLPRPLGALLPLHRRPLPLLRTAFPLCCGPGLCAV